MEFVLRLGKTAAVQLFSLLAVSSVLAAIAWAIPGPIGTLSGFAAAESVFLFTLAIGVPVVLVYGAPAFAAFYWSGRASWLVSIAIGAIPETIVYIFGDNIGPPLPVVGLSVLLITRAFLGSGANNSFKPKPLRGSA